MAQRGRGKNELNRPISKAKETARTARVSGIKARVDTGKYRVEPKKVADKMVEDAIREIRSRGH